MKKFLLFMIISLILSGCDQLNFLFEEEEENQQVYEIDGYAKYSNTESHEDIQIQLIKNGSSRSIVSDVATNNNGYYKINNLKAGDYTIFAVSNDSKEKQVSTSITVSDSNNITRALDLNLTAIGNISGKVTIDQNTTGNRGFFIVVEGTSYMAMTNDLGNFTISDIPVGNNYSVIITKQSLIKEWQIINVNKGETSSLTDILITSDELNTQNVETGKSAYDIWLELGNEGSQLDFINSLKGETGSDGSNGNNGLSAYDIWLELGNEGSQLDFINSLKGETGSDGSNGENGTSGLSAYDIWLKLGNEGTELDFINSLKGDNGLSIIWKGELDNEPDNPDVNWVYMNKEKNIAYIYNGEKWDIFFRNSNSINISKDKSIFGDWGLTAGTYEDTSDWDKAVFDEFGSEYKVVDWDDLVRYHNGNNNLLDLYNGLGLTDYGSSAYVTNSGVRNYSSTRYYFASRHEGSLPTNYTYLAHKEIGGNILSLGSWNGSNRIMVIKKQDTTDDNYLQNNIALSSLGATAGDNGYFDDYGTDQTGALAIDKDSSTYWAGLQSTSPQQMWITFDKKYKIDKVYLDEYHTSYITEGKIEYNEDGVWKDLVNINKSTQDYSVAFEAVIASGVRLTVNKLVAPGSWYNKAVCLIAFEVNGVEYIEPDKPSKITFGDFGLTANTYDDTSNWDQVVLDEFGSEYKVADWNDLVKYHSDNNNLLDLYNGLGLTDYDNSAYVTNSGVRNYSSSRYYFASRHEGSLPTAYTYLVHKEIGGNILSLGSWYGSNRIMVIKKQNTTNENYLENNIALSSLGATAGDNGYFDDYGTDQTGALAIDKDSTTFWAGLQSKSPQQMWITFDKKYKIDKVYLDEHHSSYITEGKIEYNEDGVWKDLVNINKSTQDYTVAFEAVIASGVRLTVNKLVAPGSWYNKAVCLIAFEVNGVEYIEPDKPSKITFGDFGITIGTYDDTSDWDQAVLDEFGSEYKVADWDDLVKYHNDNNNLLELYSGLGLTEYDNSAYVTNSGVRNYSSTRYYFASRHEGGLPTNYTYLAHKEIGGNILSLGSWYGSNRIMVIKK